MGSWRGNRVDREMNLIESLGSKLFCFWWFLYLHVFYVSVSSYYEG